MKVAIFLMIMKVVIVDDHDNTLGPISVLHAGQIVIIDDDHDDHDDHEYGHDDDNHDDFDDHDDHDYDDLDDP